MCPVVAWIFVTVLLLLFATHMLVPSKAMPLGLVPTLTVLTSALLLTFRTATLLLLLFATQMWVPSKVTPIGAIPTVDVPRVVPVLAWVGVVTLQIIALGGL